MNQDYGWKAKVGTTTELEDASGRIREPNLGRELIKVIRANEFSWSAPLQHHGNGFDLTCTALLSRPDLPLLMRSKHVAEGRSIANHAGFPYLRMTDAEVALSFLVVITDAEIALSDASAANADAKTRSLGVYEALRAYDSVLHLLHC